MPKRTALVEAHLENLGSAALERYAEQVRGYVRQRHGLYALYKRERLYYVGLAKNLRGRLKSHLRDRHRGLWDRFSVYLTIDHSHLKEMESLILCIVRAPGNRVKGKFASSENLERRLWRDIRRHHDEEARALFGRPPRLTPSSARADAGERPLRGVFRRAVTLARRYRGKVYKARVRRDGSIRIGRRTFDSPSAAATAICGRAVNGWNFWRYERRTGEWVRLATVRR